ncbi:MAG: hypothetical protein Q8N63_01780 [Nanoarchaeota archaeon]|nr:hypothetical protein [Nanoarchaeota archaeon]
MKKRKFRESIDFDLSWGLKGLRVSLGILLMIIFLFFVFLSVKYKDISFLKEVFSIPKGTNDYLAIFAGGILFVAVPFLLGIRTGLSLKKNMK